jgi:hypothetical protein
LVVLGDASTVGNRNTAQLRTYGDELTINIEDSLPAEAIGASSEAIASEMVARLVLALRN